MMKKLYMNGFCALIIAGSALSQSAFAALHDRGGGLLYDDVLNVTWLQDANYAKTSGYDTDGRMNWPDAKIWAANLVYHDNLRNVDYSDWRLANIAPSNGVSWSYPFSKDGSTDIGYNIVTPHSELSYMYYVNLGLKGYFSESGSIQTDWGVFGNGTLGGQDDVGLVVNLQSWSYWSIPAYEPSPHYYAWSFSTGYGSQGASLQSAGLYAWAVRPGDVAAVTTVPEPEAYAMLLAGLGLLGLVARRRTGNSA